MKPWLDHGFIFSEISIIMMRCPYCLADTGEGYGGLSDHLFSEQENNESNHIMWINRYISRKRLDENDFHSRVSSFFSTDDLKGWIIGNFIGKFYSDSPHQFLIRMQRPDRWTLLGYAYEHHHFLKQWVKSCSSIISNTDEEDVHHYEIENIISEWHGLGVKSPSHHELLLRMGESYGASRDDIYSTEPLEVTRDAVALWDRVCRTMSFVEGMVAMHSLELIANRKMKDYGASIGYFDPSILTDGSVTKETVDFLKEGYLADVSHSEIALDIIVRYSKKLGLVQPVQAVFLRSIEEFDNYLNARIERGVMLENKQH